MTTTAVAAPQINLNLFEFNSWLAHANLIFSSILSTALSQCTNEYNQCERAKERASDGEKRMENRETKKKMLNKYHFIVSLTAYYILLCDGDEINYKTVVPP